MKALRKFLGWAAVLATAGSAAALVALWLRPPDLVRIGANFAAKMVCSNVFLADRDPAEVLATDVRSPGSPLLRFTRAAVDRETGVVHAKLLGFLGDGLAQWRPGAGCAVIADGRIGDVHTPGLAGAQMTRTETSSPSALWPEGDGVALDPALERLVNEDALAGPGLRAIVVVDHGRIVAERYGGGFNVRTPQLGWSMTKTVAAVLVGMLIEQGRLSLDHSAGFAEGDARRLITVGDLLSMNSGLHFNESYGAVSDVTRMLYLEPDMARFARDQPLDHPVGSVWSYSSGTAVILSRLIQDEAGNDGPAATQGLFDTLGMRSAIIEADERGTLVGSSYMFATARDWARFGELLVQGGTWDGVAILPKGFVSFMSAPAAGSDGEYGRGLVWRWVTHSDTPGENASLAFGIPSDAFWLSGHDGQSVAVIPSKQFVVVRLGLTPAWFAYRPERLVGALLAAGPHG